MSERRGLGTIYGARVRPVDAEELSAAGALEVREQPPAGPAGARFELALPGDVAVSLSVVGAGDPALPAQIEAASAVVLQAGGGALGPTAYAALRQVTAAWQLIGVSVQGEPSEEGRAAVDRLVRVLAERLAGVVLRDDGRLLDPAGRLLLGPDGARDEEAAAPISAEARDRQARSEERLRGGGLPAPEGVGALPGADQVVLREPAAVARRAQALWAVASRGAGVERYDAIDLLFRRGLWDAATPAEQEFLRQEDPSEEALLGYRRRAEALWALLWALGRVTELGPPDRPGGLDACTRILRATSAEEFVGGAALRPVGAILDEADVVHRQHAIVAAAALAKRPIPPGLNPAIVEQRHLALLWTIRHMKQPWAVLAADPGSGLPGAAP